MENRVEVMNVLEFDSESEKSSKERVREIAISRQRSFYFTFVKLEVEKDGNWVKIIMPSHLLR